MTEEFNPNEMFIWFDPEEDDVTLLTEEEFRQRILEFKKAQEDWEQVVGG